MTCSDPALKESGAYQRQISERYDEARWSRRFRKEVKPPFGLPPCTEGEVDYIPEVTDVPIIGMTYGQQDPPVDVGSSRQGDEPLGSDELAKVQKYDAGEMARTASPLALTGGGLVSAAVLAAGGQTILAVVAGVVAFAAVAAVVEWSLRRITSSNAASD